MKKLIAILLSLTFILSVSVYAATSTIGSGREEQPVYVSYATASPEETVYSIDIKWGNMEFVYREASPGTWLPDKLDYDSSGAEGWYPKTTASSDTLASNQIVISNRSNAKIQCTATFNKDEELNDIFGNVSGSFDSESTTVTSTSFFLSSAAITKTAQEMTLSLFLSGQPLDTALNRDKIGTITVAFEPSI